MAHAWRFKRVVLRLALVLARTHWTALGPPFPPAVPNILLLKRSYRSDRVTRGVGPCIAFQKSGTKARTGTRSHALDSARPPFDAHREFANRVGFAEARATGLAIAYFAAREPM